MKTSIILIALLILNTSALLSEPLAQLVNGISPWVLIVFEVVLLVIWYVNNMLKGLQSLSQIDLGTIELFVIGPKRKNRKNH